MEPKDAEKMGHIWREEFLHFSSTSYHTRIAIIGGWMHVFVDCVLKNTVSVESQLLLPPSFYMNINLLQGTI